MILWQCCTVDRLVRVALKSSVASSSFSDSIVSWMTWISGSSGVREVRASCVENRIKLGVQFSRAGWDSFASALDSAILQLARHAVHLDTENVAESVWSRSSSSNWRSPLSPFAPITHSWLSTALRHCVLPTRIGHMPATPSFAIQTAPAAQVASLVKRDHHSAQLLLFTVVAVVVTGTLCFFTVSLSLSLFAPVLKSGPLSTCKLFFA